MPSKDLVIAHLDYHPNIPAGGVDCSTTSCQALINAPLPDLYRQALVAGCTDIGQIALLAGNLLSEAGYYCEQAFIEENQTPARFFRSIYNFIRHRDPHTQFFGGLIQTNSVVPTHNGELLTHAVAVIALHDNHKATIVDTTKDPRIRKVKLAKLNRRIWPEGAALQYNNGPLITFTRAVALIGEPISGRLTSPRHQQRRNYFLEENRREIAEATQEFIAQALKQEE